MPRLRVLSGAHAGISLDWISPRLVVGASEELDVFIGDWNAQRIELEGDGQGGCRASWSASDDALSVVGQHLLGSRMVCQLEPLVPVRFGAVILCIGPADEAWPDDAELLRRCFAPPPSSASLAPVAPARRRGRARVVIVAVTTCTLAAAAMTTQQLSDEPLRAASAIAATATARDSAVGTHPPASVPAPRADGATRLKRIVGTQALEGLAVENSGVKVVVRGVLHSRQAVDRLDRLLDALPADLPASRRFVAAPDVVDRLYGALPDVGLAVRHLEKDRFEVAGRVADPVRVGAAIQHVASDLTEFGVHVQSALQPPLNALPEMSGLLIDSQGTSYLRTRDGVKHIVTRAQDRRAEVARAERIGSPEFAAR